VNINIPLLQPKVCRFVIKYLGYEVQFFKKSLIFYS
jgi:hypothetical protein